MTTQKNLTPTQTADFLERLAQLEAREVERERERAEQETAQERLEAIKPKVRNRRTVDLGVKSGHRYCTDQHCDYYLVKVPVELRGSETETLFKDGDNNVTDRVENSTIRWDYEDPADAVCECGKTVGNLPPDTPPPAAGFDDLTALQRRRIKIGDEDALSIKQDIKEMRERQASVLAKVEAANKELLDSAKRGE